MDKSLQVVLMYMVTQLAVVLIIYPGTIIRSAHEGHAVAIFTGVAVNFLMILIYMKGLRYFPNKDIISIYLDAGKAAAVVFLLPILIYSFIFSVIMIRASSEIITIVFLVNTPIWAIMALLILISAYIAINGVESIFRTGLLLAVLFLPLVIFVICISFQNVDWRYLFPIIDKHFSFMKSESYYQSFTVFASSYLFLGFVQPFFSYKSSKVLIAAAALVPFFFIAVYVPLLSLGATTASTMKFPFVVAINMLQINWFMFDRIAILILINLASFAMLFIALLFWMTSRVVNRCLPSIKPMYIVIALSLPLFVIGVMIPNWMEIERISSWSTLLRFYVFIAVPISIYYLGLRSKRKDKHANV